MWPAFLIGLLSEFFSESKELSRFVVKGFASAVMGLILNFVLILLISRQAAILIGYEITTPSNITPEFVLVPFVAAFIAVIIVKAARYLSNMGIKT
jgi:hypothetical protein